jgi:hypothetical protein
MPSTTSRKWRLALELATLAGREIVAAFATIFRVRYKTGGRGAVSLRDPVSEIDWRIEVLIRERLAKYFPDHGVIGEELAEVQGEIPTLSGRSIPSTGRRTSSTAFRCSQRRSAFSIGAARARSGARSDTLFVPAFITQASVRSFASTGPTSRPRSMRLFCAGSPACQSLPTQAELARLRLELCPHRRQVPSILEDEVGESFPNGTGLFLLILPRRHETPNCCRGRINISFAVH